MRRLALAIPILAVGCGDGGGGATEDTEASDARDADCAGDAPCAQVACVEGACAEPVEPCEEAADACIGATCEADWACTFDPKDCDDGDPCTVAACAPDGIEAACGDGLDDDGDGLVDCADEDRGCASGGDGCP
ncbi:MAG: hypothetical protein ACQEXJ_09215 [Myxococcota bacterium]